jgi:hypothetical protein
MNITIKMLSISTFILWMTIIFFFVTAVVSVLGVNVGIGDPELVPSSKGVNISLPFYVNNTGYYELADLNLTTRVTDNTGKVIDRTETIIPSIPKNTNITARHTVPIDLDDLIAIDYLSLLLKDSSFNVELFASVNFARAIHAQFSTNTSVPWGAPLANFDLGEMSVSSFNGTHSEATIPLSFENHAILGIQGLLRLEFYDRSEQLIASGDIMIDVPAEQSFAEMVYLYPRLQDVPELTSGRDVHVFFSTAVFMVDWWEEYD